MLTVVARTGLKVRDLATKQKTVLPDNGSTKWRLTAGSGTRTVVSFFKQRWVKWRTLKGDAELAAARPADHARAPVRQGRLPRRARLAGPEARRSRSG